MRDRVVEHPHRYRLVPVEGQDGVYDFEAVPGTVTEAGTPLNKANLLSDETEKMYDLEGGAATVDGVLKVMGRRAYESGAYATDLYLYITGKHPILNAGLYGDYGPQDRTISLTGDAQTITVKDNNIMGVR